MTWSDDNQGEGIIARVVISESVYEQLGFLHQFSVACREFPLVRSSDELDDLIARCRSIECCILILQSSALLQAAPTQVTELLRRTRSLRVLARIDDDRVATMRYLLMLGCFGFLTDNITLSLLRNILCTVARGEMWFPRKLLCEGFQTLLLEQDANCLSRREREILTLLAQELSNKQMAERLFITQETLRWHLRHLYAKTRLRGRDKLIAYANEFADIAPDFTSEGRNAPQRTSKTPAADFQVCLLQ
jgi:DNA-binding NarL/FixJ family response regulator